MVVVEGKRVGNELLTGFVVPAVAVAEATVAKLEATMGTVESYLNYLCR